MTDDDESEGRRELSWIWVTASNVPIEGDEFEFAEGMSSHILSPLLFTFITSLGMRVEWAKTQARANRWQEEVLLVREEMRRVIAFLDWKATWWRSQADRRQDVRNDIKAGLAAYAARQSHLMQHLAETFAAVWYLMLTMANLRIEWPTHYISYAQAHPPTSRDARRRAATKMVDQDSGSSGSELSTENDSGAYDSADGDDADVSPYR
jgi:hypothetical protein